MLVEGRGNPTTVDSLTDHRRPTEAMYDFHPTASTPSASHTGAGFIDLIPACMKPREILSGALSANALMKSRVVFSDDPVGAILPSLMSSIVFFALAADEKQLVRAPKRYARNRNSATRSSACCVVR